MPLVLFGFLLADTLSLAWLYLAYRLYLEWDRYRFADEAYANRCLYGLIGVVLILLFGKLLIRLLVSKGNRNEPNPAQLPAHTEEKIARPDGTQIHAKQFGKADGDTLVLIHGWNATSSEWYYQIQHFESQYNIIALDLRGLGKSTRPSSKDFSLERLAEDLHAVLDHTGAKNPILWGHSIGGMTILTLMAKLPHLIRTPIKGLVLQHTTFTNPTRTSLFSKLLTAIEKPVVVPLCYVMIGLSPLIWILRWMSYLNGNSLLMTRLLVFAGTQSGRQLDFAAYLSTIAPPAVTARGMLGMLKYDVSHRLQTITTPTLVSASHSDILTKPSASRHLQQHLPNAKLIVLRPAGHMGLLERNQEANREADQFLHPYPNVVEAADESDRKRVTGD